MALPMRRSTARCSHERQSRFLRRPCRARRSSDGYRQGYAEAQRAFLIGCAIRERRQALGLSQTELARRAAMTQPPCPAWWQEA